MSETHILETKEVGLYNWRGEGRGSEKVYCLYTHENVDIFGWPLRYYCFFIIWYINIWPPYAIFQNFLMDFR